VSSGERLLDASRKIVSERLIERADERGGIEASSLVPVRRSFAVLNGTGMMAGIPSPRPNTNVILDTDVRATVPMCTKATPRQIWS
jgi:hypothetical protein